MDNFIGLVRAPTYTEILHFTCATMPRIHAVFPPPGQGKDPEDKLIYVRKLWQGNGLQSTKKEILGWLFDGVLWCLSLPIGK